MTNKYRIDYAEDGSTEITVPAGKAGTSANDNQTGMTPQQPMMQPGHGGYPYRYREPFRIPAIINTGLTICVAAALFFGAEKYGPYEFKPSTLVGGYEASIGAQLKAAELNEQARFEAYQAEVKVAAETQVKETEKLLESILQYYQALHERGRIMAQAASDMQGRYVGERMSQANQVQSADMGIISLSTLVGRGLNLYEPGMGDDALAYAEQLEQGVVQGLTQAAQEGARVDLHDWDLGVPEPTEVARLVARVPVMEIPEPPPLARHYNATQPVNDSASQNGGR
jgi:hypothetical protein